MAYAATVLRVLIASPGDVPKERAAIPDVIHSWDAVHSHHLRVVLLPVMWETHATPELGDRPQAIINRQLVKDCDVLVGSFWTRLGTPTGQAESGTVEEIREFLAAGKPVLLYFSTVPVALESVDVEQYTRLKAFMEECRASGLVAEYNSLAELRDRLRDDLLRTVRDRLGFTGGAPDAPAEALSCRPAQDGTRAAREPGQAVRRGVGHGAGQRAARHCRR